MRRQPRAQRPRQSELPLGLFKRSRIACDVVELSPTKERELRLALADLLTAAAKLAEGRSGEAIVAGEENDR